MVSSELKASDEQRYVDYRYSVVFLVQRENLHGTSGLASYVFLFRVHDDIDQ